MMNAKEAVVAMDYAIGYALMRARFNAELQALPAPVLARTLGVPVDALNAFVDGGEPGSNLWKAGHRYAGGREPPEIEPVDIALNLLADTFPLAERVRVRKALADVLVPALHPCGWRWAHERQRPCMALSAHSTTRAVREGGLRVVVAANSFAPAEPGPLLP